MQRTSRRIWSALAGVLIVAGSAAAQSPTPRSLPPLPPLPAVSLTAEAASAPAGAGLRPASGGLVVTDGAGSGAISTARPARPLLAPIPYGQPGPAGANGCGSCKSTTGFIFGPCRSFFDPCGPIPAHGPRCGHGKLGCLPCGIHPFGHPYGQPFNGCVYDSYLNH